MEAAAAIAAPLIEMFRHNLWANLRMIDYCAGLEDRVLDASVIGTAGSIRETLAHIVDAEAGYVATLTETQHPPREFAHFPGFPELRRRAEASGGALIAFVEGQNLDGVVRGVFHGRPYEHAVWVFLVHAITHAAEHRAHINTILTQQGVEPLVLDAVLFSREVKGG